MIGYAASATNTRGITIGFNALTSTSAQAIAIGSGPSATGAPQCGGTGAIAIGASNASGVAGARGSADYGIAIGSGDASVAGAAVTAANGIALGRGASAGHATAVAIGAGSATTATNQIRLGTASEDVNIPGTLTLSGGAVTPGAWTSYTPTLDQGGAVTKTVTYAKYARMGKTIFVQGLLSVTGSGTASNAVIFGLPVAAAVSTVNHVIGVGDIFDTSATSDYKGIAVINDANSAYLRPTAASTNGVLGADTFTAALASGDVVRFSLTYEAA